MAVFPLGFRGRSLRGRRLAAGAARCSRLLVLVHGEDDGQNDIENEENKGGKPTENPPRASETGEERAFGFISST
jgi:hypothetical protein